MWNERLRMWNALTQAVRTGLALQLTAFLAVGPLASRAWADESEDHHHPELVEVINGVIEETQFDSLEFGDLPNLDDAAGKSHESYDTGTRYDVSSGSVGAFLDYDIGTTEAVDVNFETAGGRHIALITNGLETHILGGLFSNGEVYLLNPAGVLIGADAHIDLVGFHAAGGGLADFDHLSGRDEYVGLTGRVRNEGTIIAEIVDLVGRYVENLGTIEGAEARPDHRDHASHESHPDHTSDSDHPSHAAHPDDDPEHAAHPDLAADPNHEAGHDDDPRDGARSFVLASGQTVTIRRVRGSDGYLREALVELGKASVAADGDDEAGVLIGAEGVIDATTDADAPNSLSQIVIVSIADRASAVELGSGDAFGMALFAAGSRVSARDISVRTRGSDIELGGELTGESIEICAGASTCGAGVLQIAAIGNDTFDSFAFFESDTGDAVELLDGAAIELVSPSAAADGADGKPGTEDDSASRLLIAADRSLAFSADRVEGPAPFDLDLRSRDGVVLSGEFSARELRALSGREVRSPTSDALLGDIPITSGDVTLTDETTISAERIFLEGDEIIGLVAGSLQTDDVRSEVAERVQLFQGNGFTVDDDLAAALSGGLEDSTLALRSSTAITVTAEDLSAGLIELWAGASDGSDLVLAAGSGLHAKRNEIPSSGASNSAEEVASIVLRAGLGSIRALERSEQARVVIAADVTMTDHVTMTDPKGTRLAGFSLDQDAPIDAATIPDRAQFDGSGPGDPDEIYTRSFRSRNGLLTLDDAGAARLIGAGTESDGELSFEDENLSLALRGPDGTIFAPAIGTRVESNLSVHDLTLGNGSLSSTLIDRDLTVQQDLLINGESLLGELDGPERDSALRSLEGTLSFDGDLVKRNKGDLILEAGKDLDLAEDEFPIRFEVGVGILEGDLVLDDSFVSRGAIAFEVNGELTFGDQGHFRGDGLQVLTATKIVVEEGAALIKDAGVTFLDLGGDLERVESRLQVGLSDDEIESIRVSFSTDYVEIAGEIRVDHPLAELVEGDDGDFVQVSGGDPDKTPSFSTVLSIHANGDIAIADSAELITAECEFCADAEAAGAPVASSSRIALLAAANPDAVADDTSPDLTLEVAAGATLRSNSISFSAARAVRAGETDDLGTVHVDATLDLTRATLAENAESALVSITPSVVIEQGAALLAENLINATAQFSATGPVAYTLRSRADDIPETTETDAEIALTIDDDFALALGSNDEIELEIVSRGSIGVQTDLAGKTLSLLSGQGTADERNLVVGVDAGPAIVLTADEITLRAGDGSGDASTVDLVADLDLTFESAAGGGSPASFSLIQDADVSVAAAPSLDRFTDSEPFTYALRSAGTLTVDEEFGGDNVALVLESAGQLDVQNDLTGSEITLHAGGSSAGGDLTIGNEEEVVEISADRIVLRAGSTQSSESDSSVIVTEHELADDDDDPDNNPVLLGASFFAPSSELDFTMQQNAGIDDDELATAEQFGSSGDALRYTLISNQGSIEIETLAVIEGTHLHLVAADGVTIEGATASEVLSLAALSVGEAEDSGSGQTTDLTLHHSLVVENAIDIHGALELIGSANDPMPEGGSIDLGHGLVDEKHDDLDEIPETSRFLIADRISISSSDGPAIQYRQAGADESSAAPLFLLAVGEAPEDGISIDGQIDTAGRGQLGENPTDAEIAADSSDGGDVSLFSAGDISLTAIVTRGDLSTDPTPEQDPEFASGDIRIHADGVVTLNAVGTTSTALDAGVHASRNDLTASRPGNVLVAGAEILIGSDEHPRDAVVRIFGHDIELRTEEEGLVGSVGDPDSGDRPERRLIIDSVERQRFEETTVDMVTVITRIVEGGEVSIDVSGDGIVLDSLHIGRTEPAGSVEIEAAGIAVDALTIDTDGDLTLRVDEISAMDGESGTELQLSARGELSFGAGESAIHATTVVLSTGTAIDLDEVDFTASSVPSLFELRQVESILGDDLDAILDSAVGADLTAPEGMRLEFVSTGGGVQVGSDAAERLTNTRLTLEGSESGGVVVGADLDVYELNLGSDAVIEGDLTVSQAPLRTVGNAGFSGDLEVDGDLKMRTRARFVGENTDGDPVSQTLDVAGSFEAPAIERAAGPVLAEGDEAPEETPLLSISAADGIVLRGSVVDDDLAVPMLSADIAAGSLLVEDSAGLRALGDMTAEVDLNFDVHVEFDEAFTRPDPGPEQFNDVGFDQKLIAGGQVLLAAQDVSIDGAPILKRAGDLSIEASEYTLTASESDEDPAIHIEDGDLTLSGDGTITGAGLQQFVAGGSLTVAGALRYNEDAGDSEGSLRFEAGDDSEDAIFTSATISAPGSVSFDSIVETTGETHVSGANVSFAGAIRGSSDLDVEAIDGKLILFDDVALGADATLTLHSSELRGVSFEKDGGTQTVEAGAIALDPGSRATPHVPTIIREGGGLVLRATRGNFSMGTGSKLAVEGDLEISAANTATISDLGATNVAVTARTILVASRGPAPVELPDGTTRVDWGVDVVGNSVSFSNTPSGGGLTVAANAVSDTLIDDGIVVRAINADGGPLVAGDQFCAGELCDLIGQGAPRSESARALSVQTPVIQRSGPLQLAGLNDVGAGQRPLWAAELITYLAAASVGGEQATAATANPRFQNEAVQRALSLYRGMFAPTILLDENTGVLAQRSHLEQIRAALQRAEDAYAAAGSSPLTGSGLVVFMRVESRHGEALFYLETLGEIVRQAYRSGMRGSDFDRFAELLVADLAPSRLGAAELASVLNGSDALTAP